MVADGNILFQQCSSSNRKFSQLHYRRGLNLAAIPPPINEKARQKWWAFFIYWVDIVRGLICVLNGRRGRRT